MANSTDAHGRDEWTVHPDIKRGSAAYRTAPAAPAAPVADDRRQATATTEAASTHSRGDTPAAAPPRDTGDTAR